MLSLKSKIVFITGASSGIGKAAAELFAAQGAKLVLTARRLERLQNLKQTLEKEHNCMVLPLTLDVRDKQQVKKTIEELPTDWRDIDILVNNAGLALGTDKIQDGNVDNWDVVINTNVQGLLYVTRAILPTMVARKAGHIINIGSIAGHEYYSAGNIYCATKHAVRALSKCLRIDLMGTGIRVTDVAPGMVHTEFSEVRWKDKERADKFYEGMEALTAHDIADAIVYCATRPLHVDVAEIVITPTAQASANHLYREGVPKPAGGMFD